MDIAGQVAVVTGAAVRVGRAIALHLARAGADVVVHYNTSAASAKTLADEIEALGRRAAPVQADLSMPPSACEAILAAADGLGGAAILVNNASLYTPGRPGELSRDQLDRLWQVNAVAPAMLAQQAARRMADASPPGGCIVNILDVQARRPWPRYLAYCMSKGALWSATVGLARDLAPGVRVNGVAPGVVLWNDQDPGRSREQALAQIPLGRLGDPSDVAAAVRFCIESDYLTGQVIHVDGGRSM